jgi:hypothetical protein
LDAICTPRSAAQLLLLLKDHNGPILLKNSLKFSPSRLGWFHLTEEWIDMMGHQGGVQDKLFYSFNLDDHVPQSHVLRGIDWVFDFSDLRHHLAPFYGHTGAPSIDPD